MQLMEACLPCTLVEVLRRVECNVNVDVACQHTKLCDRGRVMRFTTRRIGRERASEVLGSWVNNTLIARTIAISEQDGIECARNMPHTKSIKCFADVPLKTRDLPPGKRSALARDPWYPLDRSWPSCRWSPAPGSVPRAAWMHRRCTHCIDCPHRWHCSLRWASPALYASQCSQLRRWPVQWVVPFFCISRSSVRPLQAVASKWLIALWSWKVKIGPIEAKFLLTSTKILPKHTHTHTHHDLARIFCLVNGACACACQSVYVSACTCMCESVCYYVCHLP